MDGWNAQVPMVLARGSGSSLMVFFLRCLEIDVLMGKYSGERSQPMFCVLYKFIVKPGHDSQFRQHWLAVTQWYYRHAGSLGARLHRASTGEYIAYTQCASRAEWEQQGDMSDAELQAHRQAMRECCEAIEVVYELDVTDDWLQREVYGREA
jgi:hypothetical protein